MGRMDRYKTVLPIYRLYEGDECMIYSATWEKLAELLLKSQGVKDEKVKMYYIADGRFNVETEKVERK